MSVGNDYADAYLDAIWGASKAAHIPGTVYITLYYVEPSDAGGGTEADYDTFARVSLTNNGTNFPAAADREKALAIEVDFPTPGEDTDPFVAWGIHGHATNDDLMQWAPFAEPYSAKSGEPVTIEAGAIVFTVP